MPSHQVASASVVDSIDIKAIYEYDRSQKLAHKGADIRKKFNGTGNHGRTNSSSATSKRRPSWRTGGPVGVEKKEKERLALGDASASNSSVNRPKKKDTAVSRLPKLSWDDDGEATRDYPDEGDFDREIVMGKENMGSSSFSVGLADLVRPSKARKEPRRPQPIRKRTVDLEALTLTFAGVTIEEELLSPLLSDGESYDSDDDGIEEYEFMLPGADGAWEAVDSCDSVIIVRGW